MYSRASSTMSYWHALIGEAAATALETSSPCYIDDKGCGLFGSGCGVTEHSTEEEGGEMGGMGGYAR